jgi:hypothetical protein
MLGPRTRRQGNVRTPLSPGPFPLLSQGKGSSSPESPPSSSAGGGIERGGVQESMQFQLSRGDGLFVDPMIPRQSHGEKIKPQTPRA